MVDNTTELLSLIVKTMSMNDTEITNVKIYEQAVEINNKVKIRITNRGYIINKENASTGAFCYLESDMLTKVLNLLFENDWLPGDDIEAYGEWYTLVVEDEYYRLLDENYSLSERMTLEDLRNNYTNASLERGGICMDKYRVWHTEW